MAADTDVLIVLYFLELFKFFSQDFLFGTTIIKFGQFKLVIAINHASKKSLKTIYTYI
jgi:hypothetical protein